MGDLRQSLDVGDIELGIAESFGVERFRLGVDRLADAVEVISIHEADGDAELGQRVVEEVVGATVERCGRDDLVARACEGEDRQGFGSLTRRSSEAAAPPSSAAIRFSKTSVVGFMMRV